VEGVNPQRKNSRKGNNRGNFGFDEGGRGGSLKPRESSRGGRNRGNVLGGQDFSAHCCRGWQVNSLAVKGVRKISRLQKLR